MKWHKLTNRPPYYRPVLVRCNIYGSMSYEVAWLASNGDRDIWTINGTNICLSKKPTKWAYIE